MADQTHAGFVFSLQTVSRVCGVVAAIIGGGVLLGWGLELPTLRSGLPGLASMKPNSAFCFILAGLSLLLIRVGRGGPGRWLGQLLGGMVALVGLLTLAEYAGGWDLGIDQL